MKITRFMLEQQCACDSQVMLFNDLFPHGVELTEELCLLHAQVFDWPWAASHLLPSSARVAYRRQEAILYIDYTSRAARVPIVPEDYAKQCGLMSEEYRERQKLLLAEYRRQQAALFYRCATV